MSGEPYLARLNARLAEGLSRLPAGVRTRHGAYLAAAQNRDGGFSGREGGSDLYYTGFALRGLAVLDALDADVCGPAAQYLRGCLTQQASVIDLFSLLYSCLLIQASSGINALDGSPADWPDRVAAVLESCRTADGGYAKSPGAADGSTYHTFLVGLCYQLLQRPFPDAGGVARFIASRRREDGGFVELAAMRKSGTNPTAAGVGTFQLLGAEITTSHWTPEVREGVVHYVATMPSVEGGLRANGRIPAADLLSTFTGCWTLHELGALDRLDCTDVLHFVQALEQRHGGFHAGLWDDRADVEYTFYGLGTFALLIPN